MKKVLFVLFSVLLFGCSEKEDEPVYAERIDIDKKELTMEIGEEVFVKCNVYPSDAIDGKLYWGSPDQKLIEFDGKGMIRAKKEGLARIKINNVSQTIIEYITVNIKPRIVEGISMTFKEVEMKKGETKQLYATVLPTDASDKKIEWVSSDINIVKVSADGSIYAVNVGECTITAISKSNPSISAPCKLTVLPPPASAIQEIRFESYLNSLVQGETIALKVNIMPENYIEEKMIWSSEDTSIATVDQNGNVTGVGTGLTTIVVKTSSGRVSADCRVNVKERTDIVKIVLVSSSTTSINGYVTGNVIFSVYNGTERSIDPVRVYITESYQNGVVLEVNREELSSLGIKQSSAFWEATFRGVYRPVVHCDYISEGKSYTISKEI